MKQQIYIKGILALLCSVALLTGCKSKDSLYDASGTFEAEEVIVSSEADGKIVMFDVAEGALLEQDKVYGLIDTVQLSLKRDQLLAGIDAALERKQDVDQQTAVYYGLPMGAYVSEVNVGSAAEKAGVQAKDIIIAIGENSVTSLNELTRVLEKFDGGEETTITVWRGGREMVLDITLDARTADF